MVAENRLGWPLASVCFFGWALATTYTNHAPLIPVFMERLGLTPTAAGLLSLVFFLSMAAVSLPVGILSDRLGPKQICSVGLAITCLSNVGLGLALSLPYSAVMNTATAAVPESPGAAVGVVGGLSLILIALGAPALGALYSRTESFSLAFGLLGAFAGLVFGLTYRIQDEAAFAAHEP